MRENERVNNKRWNILMFQFVIHFVAIFIRYFECWFGISVNWMVSIWYLFQQLIWGLWWLSTIYTHYSCMPKLRSFSWRWRFSWETHLWAHIWHLTKSNFLPEYLHEFYVNVFKKAFQTLKDRLSQPSHS